MAAVHADIRHRLKTGNVSGRLQKVGCHAVGRRRPDASPIAASREVQNVNYPYVGVFTKTTRHVTYCKRDLPPIPTENIPVSARCTL